MTTVPPPAAPLTLGDLRKLLAELDFPDATPLEALTRQGRLTFLVLHGADYVEAAVDEIDSSDGSVYLVSEDVTKAGEELHALRKRLKDAAVDRRLQCAMAILAHFGVSQRAFDFALDGADPVRCIQILRGSSEASV